MEGRGKDAQEMDTQKHKIPLERSITITVKLYVVRIFDKLELWIFKHCF